MAMLPDAAGSNDPEASVERLYQDHFARMYHRVIDDSRIGKLGLAAYVALARFADWATGASKVRRTKLAATARLSVRGLDAGLAELVDCGYLTITRIQNPDGSWAASSYQLLDTALAQAVVSQGGGAGPALGGSAGGAPPPSAPAAPGVAQDLHEGGARPAHQERETVNKRQENEKPAELPLDGGAGDLAVKQSFNRRAQALASRYVELVPLSRFPAILGIVKKALTAGYDDAMVLAALERLAADGRSVTVESLRIELEGLTPARVAAHGQSRTEQRVQAGLEVARRMAEREAAAGQ